MQSFSMRSNARFRHGQRDKRNLLVLYMLIQKILQMDQKPPLTIALIGTRISTYIIQ